MRIDYDDGSYYEGELNERGELHGLGIVVWENESYYVGELKDGHMCGYGLMVWAEDEYYEGYWENDERNGIGRSVFPSGLVVEGSWEDDRILPLTEKNDREDPLDTRLVTITDPKKHLERIRAIIEGV